MALEKLRYGFVQVHTLAGLRYVKPNFWERLHLLWIFRNFSDLSERVLSASQRRFITSLCAPERMFQHWEPDEQERAESIGTLLTSMPPVSTRAEAAREEQPLISSAKAG